VGESVSLRRVGLSYYCGAARTLLPYLCKRVIAV